MDKFFKRSAIKHVVIPKLEEELDMIKHKLDEAQTDEKINLYYRCIEAKKAEIEGAKKWMEEYK